MAKPGLEYPDYKGRLKRVAAKSGWALCVGAGISKGPFPDWNELAKSLMEMDVGATESLFVRLSSEFNLDALIQGSFERMGQSAEEFIEILSDLLYKRIRQELGQEHWKEFALVLTSGSAGQVSHKRWVRFKKVVLDNYPQASSFKDR